MRRWMEASPGSKRIDITPCSMDIMPEPVLRYTSGCISPFGDPIMSFHLAEDAVRAILLAGMRHEGHRARRRITHGLAGGRAECMCGK